MLRRSMRLPQRHNHVSNGRNTSLPFSPSPRQKASRNVPLNPTTPSKTKHTLSLILKSTRNSNTTTGELLPDWHSPYPSGISVYAPSGYFSYDVTANDTMQPEFRPRNISLPAQPGDSVNAWATIAQHSLGGGGPFTLVNVTEGSNNNATTWSNGTSSDGIRGTQLSTFRSATLPALVGVTLENEFEFFDGCDVHMLRSYPAPGTVQTAFFYRLPENAPTA